METYEIANPLASAKLVTDGADPRTYHKQTLKRGELGYTMSRSSLMEFAWNPRRWVKGFERKETDSTEWGSLVDCLVLTPDQFDSLYAVAPAVYPATPKKKGDPVEMKDWNWNSNYCGEWAAQREMEGRTVVSQKDYNFANAAARALKTNGEFSELLMASKSQVLLTASYHDREHEVIIPLKMLIDLVPGRDHRDYGDKLADMKTSQSGNLRKWRRTVFDHNLHVQAAMYLDAYNLATGEERTTFLHPVQENYAPYEVTLRFLSAEYVNLGRAVYRAALKRYAKCVVTQQWPGYTGDGMEWNGWQITDPEPWMLEQSL